MEGIFDYREMNSRTNQGLNSSTIPSGYKRLEYIENTSEAYIDTGCEIGEKFEIGASVMPMFGRRSGSLRYSGYLLGIRYDNARFFYTGGANNDFYGVRNGYVEIQKNSIENTMLYFKYSYSSIDIRCGSYHYTDNNINASFPYPFSLYLFARNNGGSYEEDTQGTWRIYTTTCMNDGVPIRNYIPCMNLNNVVGLYDTVFGVFYSSPNGIPFVAGPRVPDITKQWPQGTGNLYAAFNGEGNGTIDIWSDPNDLSQPRSMTLDIHTLDGSRHESLLVRQLSA